MTEANQLRLYKHFIAEGMTDNAKQILKAYPQFANMENEEEPKQEEVEEAEEE